MYGNLSFRFVKKTPKRITNPFYGFASVLKKSSSGIKDSAFIAIKRGAKFLKTVLLFLERRSL